MNTPHLSPWRLLGLAGLCLCLLTAACSSPSDAGKGTDTMSDVADTTGDESLPPDTNAESTPPDTARPPESDIVEETDPPSVTPTPDPVFSLPGGITDGGATLSLSLPEGMPKGAYIVYTDDGSEPDAKGTRYRRKIPLFDGNDCTVIRAAVFNAEGTQVGHTVTMSYIKEGASALRVVSLVTEPANLYGSSGIFTDRTETGRAGECPVSVEIIEPDGTVLLRQDAAIRLSGAGSRVFDPANLRIVARKPDSFPDGALKYSGTGKFHARLFDASDCTSYDRFLLRSGGNDSLHQARDGFLRMNSLRDAVANNVCAKAETLLGGTVFAQYTTPVAVYINGEYYGLLHMKQDFDENLLETAYGLPEEGTAILKGKKNGKEMYYSIESGTEKDLSDWQSLCDFCAEHALSSDYAEAYERVAAELDVENFSRYFAVMLYLCNTDWPQNNTMVFRYTPTEGDGTEGTLYADGKWRAVIRDMDLCFALHDKASQTSSTTYSMADTDTFYRITVFYRDGGYRYDESLGLYDDTMGFQGLFDFLIRSEEFRRIFREDCTALASDAFAELCREEVERYYALTTPDMPAHIALWKGKGEIFSGYTVRHFTAAKQDMLGFIEERPAYFLRYMEEALAYYGS